jgi:hypothetical protein
MMRRFVPVLAGALATAAAATAVVGAQAPGRHLESVKKTPPLIGGYYNGHRVTYLLTDVSTKKDAKALSKATHFRVTYSAKLKRVPDSALAKLFLFTNGVKGPNPFGFQPNVIDSVPGQPRYSPLWRVYAVTWKEGSSARELKSEAQILEARAAGELTVKKTALIKNSPVV